MDKMSFLPEDYLEKRIELRANMICLSLFAVVLVAIIVVGMQPQLLHTVPQMLA